MFLEQNPIWTTAPPPPNPPPKKKKKSPLDPNLTQTQPNPTPNPANPTKSHPNPNPNLTLTQTFSGWGKIVVGGAVVLRYCPDTVPTISLSHASAEGVLWVSVLDYSEQNITK